MKKGSKEGWKNDHRKKKKRINKKTTKKEQWKINERLKLRKEKKNNFYIFFLASIHLIKIFYLKQIVVQLRPPL